MSKFMKYFNLIWDLYSPTKSNKKFPEVKVTWSGAVYADPEDILESENAKRQLKELKRTEFVKEIKDKKAKKHQDKFHTSKKPAIS